MSRALRISSASLGKDCVRLSGASELGNPMSPVPECVGRRLSVISAGVIFRVSKNVLLPLSKERYCSRRAASVVRTFHLSCRDWLLRCLLLVCLCFGSIALKLDGALGLRHILVLRGVDRPRGPGFERRAVTIPGPRSTTLGGSTVSFTRRSIELTWSVCRQGRGVTASVRGAG